MQHHQPHLPRTPDSLIGRVVSDRYRIVRKLGAPGLGGLYFAEHLLVNRNVALKVILPEVRRPDVLQSFLDEARTVARLAHENIIEIFCCGQSPDGFIFLAMEYLEGEDLGRVLAREGALPWSRVKAITRQVAGALARVSAHQIVHRDLTPANIFLTPHAGTRDFVKLLNFGVVRLTSAGLEEGETGSGPLCSGSDYVAPELALSQPVDQRADIYSLGCVMYQMLTGTPPFTGSSIIDVVNKHIQDRPTPPRQRRPDLDIAPDVDALVMRALEKDPDRRFQTAAELCAAIDACRNPSRRLRAFSPPDTETHKNDGGGPRAARHPSRLVALAIAALSCAAAALVYTALHGP